MQQYHQQQLQTRVALAFMAQALGLGVPWPEALSTKLLLMILLHVEKLIKASDFDSSTSYVLLVDVVLPRSDDPNGQNLVGAANDGFARIKSLKNLQRAAAREPVAVQLKNILDNILYKIEYFGIQTKKEKYQSTLRGFLPGHAFVPN